MPESNTPSQPESNTTPGPTAEQDQPGGVWRFNERANIWVNHTEKLAVSPAALAELKGKVPTEVKNFPAHLGRVWYERAFPVMAGKVSVHEFLDELGQEVEKALDVPPEETM